MDLEVKKANNCLKVLSGATELASKFAAVSKILQKVQKLTSAFPLIGASLGLINCFLPVSQHDELLRSFSKLSNKIDQVRDDIKDLEKMIKWEITQVQYGDVVDRIQLGMKFSFEIGKATEEAQKTRFQNRLKEVCANQSFTLAMDALFAGMIGDGLFRKSILDEFYDTTKGDRPKISALAIRLLQLVGGGMIVLATYETVMRGKKGAEEMTNLYKDRLKKVNAKVQSVLDRCADSFKENMLSDINSFLDTGRSNESLRTEMSALIRDKYDWLENYCLVYNDSAEHFFDGNHVSSVNRSGKCGVVFYRKKGEAPKFSNRYDEALKIVDEVWTRIARQGYDKIQAKTTEKGIGVIGCAVVGCRGDLSFGGTFSTKVVSVIGKEKLVAIGIRGGAMMMQGATQILLLQ